MLDAMSRAALNLSLSSGVASLEADAWNRLAFNGLRGDLDSRRESAFASDSLLQASSDKPLLSQRNQILAQNAAESGELALRDLRREADSNSQRCVDAAESSSEQTGFNPFVSHAFLSALEDSGCVGSGTGWTPATLIAERDGALAGAAPSYLKTHSQGEYVFDHAWADAYERAGGRYYPKLQVSVPFTPVTGPRLFARTQETRAALASGLVSAARQIGASSVHVTFPHEAEARALEAQGWLLRIGEQFQFRNDGYRDYDDFLSTLASRKRKALKRERREALTQGIEIEWLSGAAITEAHWDAFFDFYMDTGARKWGRPYLNRAFFSLLGERLGESVLLVTARRGRRLIAGALNLIGSDALYGRYWGAVEDVSFLHFELCYHQAIDFALARGLARVEAGAQGEHKLARGYRPTPTYSAHYILDPGLRRAVADYLVRERAHMLAAIAADDESAPFRKSPQ